MVVVCALVLLNAAAVIAPLWGLFGLWRSARAEAAEVAAAPKSEDGGVSVGEFDAIIKILRRTMVQRPASAGRDLLLIGGGIIAGGVANVIGLLGG